MSVELNAVLPYLHSRMRDCPPALIIMYTRMAVIEFCRMTHYWQADLEPIDIEAGEPEYELESGIDGAIIHRILSVTLDDSHLQPVSEYEWSDDKSSLVLQHAPIADKTGALKVRAALKPAQDATEIDNERMWEDHLETFIAGAAMHLYLEKDKPWSNLPLAEVSRIQYLNGIGKAKDEIRRRRLNTLNTVRPTFGFL